MGQQTPAVAVANRVYAVSRHGEFGTYMLTEIHSEPKPETRVIELPKDLTLASIGSCAIDPKR